MLFQDFAPAYLMDFNPYCKVFYECHLYVLAWYHVDELVKVHQNNHENKMGNTYLQIQKQVSSFISKGSFSLRICATALHL